MGRHKPRLPKLCCVSGCGTELSEHGSYICKHHLQYLSTETRREYNRLVRETDGIHTEYFERKELIEIVKTASREIEQNRETDL